MVEGILESRAKYRKIVQAGIARWVKAAYATLSQVHVSKHFAVLENN